MHHQIGRALCVAAAAVGVAMITPAAGSASTSIGSARPETHGQADAGKTATATSRVSAKRGCSATPSIGWVLFYHDSGCGGVYQGWARCGHHFFTGPMRGQASSYWDRQTGGANALVFGRNGIFAFETHPGTGVRNVATWENDRSYTAILQC